MLGRELVGALLDDPRHFAKEWLDKGAKTVVPVVVSLPEAKRLVTRFLSYAREADIGHVLVARIDEGGADEEIVRIPTARDGFSGMPHGCGGGFLLVLPDLWGSVLVIGEGYALVAGSSHFTQMLVGAGADEARARFSRQARRLRSSRPGMTEVSEELPPRRIVSSTSAQVDPESVVAEQLALMSSLVEGKISGAAFASGWLAARNRAMAEGERTRGVLDGVLTDVFYALEDYAIDPDLREPGDLSDRELVSRIRMALDTLRSLEAL